MKDPWRVVDPIKEAQRIGADYPDPDKPGKINHAGERDLDADWQPHRSCFLRFKACSIEICGPDLQTPRDALEKLARCVNDLWSNRELRSRMMTDGLVAMTRNFTTMPVDAGTAARLCCEDVSVAFVGQTLDQGALKLTRFLIEMSRSPSTAAVLKKHGITPMLRTT